MLDLYLVCEMTFLNSNFLNFTHTHTPPMSSLSFMGKINNAKLIWTLVALYLFEVGATSSLLRMLFLLKKKNLILMYDTEVAIVYLKSKYNMVFCVFCCSIWQHKSEAEWNLCTWGQHSETETEWEG